MSENHSNSAGDNEAANLRVGYRMRVHAYSSDGTLLLSAGQVVCADMLERLQSSGISFGWCPPAKPVDEEPEPSAVEKSIPSYIPQTHHKAYSVRNEALESVHTVFDRIESTGALDLPNVESTVCDLMDQVVSDGLAVASLTQIKDADAYTYSHSVNVCILGMYLALTTSYEKEIRSIGIGGLLHDIGKLAVPDELLKRAGPLSDVERKIVEEHPKLGVELLVRSGCKDAIVLSCVQDHHEKRTGFGYPRHKPASEVSPYAKMTSLADVFDALTTDRPYRAAMAPEHALLLMVTEMGHQFDPWLLRRFVEAVGSIAKSAFALSGRTDMPSEESIKGLIRKAEPVQGMDSAA